MNSDERQSQFLLEKACDAVDDILEVYHAGLDAETHAGLGAARRLMGMVLDAWQRDPENPDCT